MTPSCCSSTIQAERADEQRRPERQQHQEQQRVAARRRRLCGDHVCERIAEHQADQQLPCRYRQGASEDRTKDMLLGRAPTMNSSPSRRKSSARKQKESVAGPTSAAHHGPGLKLAPPGIDAR